MSSRAPIILIGTQRSGTTWLGDVFSRHPRLAYAPEPRHIWTWGHGYNGDDVLTAADATPRIAAHIRRAFDRYVRDQGRERLVEKTPSNCLRIPFIHAVFPEAYIVLLIRDGRSVIRSTREIMARGVPPSRILRRAAQTPLWEWPAYAGPAVRALARRMSRRELDFWGPRPPGWRKWIGRFPPEVVLAKQWAGTISRAVSDGRALPSDRYLEVRTEELVAAPRPVLERVCDFVGLRDAGPVIDHAEATADRTTTHKWRDELDERTLVLVRPHIEPALRALGYEW